MPEIVVENEPWLGLVVLADTSRPFDSPGYYALARADEWHNVYENVTLWRGPEKREEIVLRRQMTEEDCRTVLVDEHGFYTCPPILEDLEADVKEESEKLLDEMANERMAESASYVDQENAVEKYGDKVFVKAEFGDAIAVNGELTSSQKHQKPPRNYVLTDLGGRYPSGEEEELEKESLIWEIAQELTKKLRRQIYEETVSEILDKLYKKDYIMWSSGSGHVEVWASKRAIQEAETELERKHRLEDEATARRAVAERKRREEERERARILRQEKIKRGGFPGPKDWSPRGRLPGER